MFYAIKVFFLRTDFRKPYRRFLSFFLVFLLIFADLRNAWAAGMYDRLDYKVAHRFERGRAYFPPPRGVLQPAIEMSVLGTPLLTPQRPWGPASPMPAGAGAGAASLQLREAPAPFVIPFNGGAFVPFAPFSLPLPLPLEYPPQQREDLMPRPPAHPSAHPSASSPPAAKPLAAGYPEEGAPRTAATPYMLTPTLPGRAAAAPPPRQEAPSVGGEHSSTSALEVAGVPTALVHFASADSQQLPEVLQEAAHAFARYGLGIHYPFTWHKGLSNAIGIILPLGLLYNTQAESILLSTSLFSFATPLLSVKIFNFNNPTALPLASASQFFRSFFYNGCAWMAPFIALKMHKLGKTWSEQALYVPCKLARKDWWGIKWGLLFIQAGGAFLQGVIPLAILYLNIALLAAELATFGYNSNTGMPNFNTGIPGQSILENPQSTTAKTLSSYPMSLVLFIGVAETILAFKDLEIPRMKLDASVRSFLSSRNPQKRQQEGYRALIVHDLKRALDTVSHATSAQIPEITSLIRPAAVDEVLPLEGFAQLKRWGDFGKKAVPRPASKWRLRTAYGLSIWPTLAVMAGDAWLGWDAFRTVIGEDGFGVSNEGALNFLGALGGLCGGLAGGGLTFEHMPLLVDKVLSGFGRAALFPSSTTSYRKYQWAILIFCLLQGAVFASPFVIALYNLIAPPSPLYGSMGWLTVNLLSDFVTPLTGSTTPTPTPPLSNISYSNIMCYSFGAYLPIEQAIIRCNNFNFQFYQWSTITPTITTTITTTPKLTPTNLISPSLLPQPLVLPGSIGSICSYTLGICSPLCGDPLDLCSYYVLSVTPHVPWLVGWIIPYMVGKTVLLTNAFFTTFVQIPYLVVDGYSWLKKKFGSGREMPPTSPDRQRDAMVESLKSFIALVRNLPGETVDYLYGYKQDQGIAESPSAPTVSPQPSLWQQIKNVWSTGSRWGVRAQEHQV